LKLAVSPLTCVVNAATSVELPEVMLTLWLSLWLGQPLLVTVMSLLPAVLHWIEIELDVLGVALPSCDQFQPLDWAVAQPLMAVKVS
jgi:hypothetical protein